MTRGEVTGCPDLEALLQEHRALLTAYGAVQRRCNALLDAQALQIQSLTAQVVRLRAALVVRDTARALSIANRHWHKDTMPAVLCVGTQGPHAAVAQRVVEMVGGHFLHHDGLADGDEHGAEALEASLVAADEQNFMERAYLDELARQLGIDDALKQRLEQEFRDAAR